jgi:hypothetical protein
MLTLTLKNQTICPKSGQITATAPPCQVIYEMSLKSADRTLGARDSGLGGFGIRLIRCARGLGTRRHSDCQGVAVPRKPFTLRNRAAEIGPEGRSRRATTRVYRVTSGRFAAQCVSRRCESPWSLDTTRRPPGSVWPATRPASERSCESRLLRLASGTPTSV